MIGASSSGPMVSKSDRNVGFELLDADIRKIYSHLQFGRADDSVTRQIRALTAENLVLRQKAEANLSQLLIEGKSQDPISLPSPMDISSSWKSLLVNEGNTAGVLELQFFPPSWKLVATPPPAVGELGVKKWQSSLVGYFLVKDQLVRIPIWIQLYNIPLEYWTAPGLSYVASAIGRPLYANSMTEKCRRLSYARLANENHVEIIAKYPWKPLQCLDCKVFSHNGAGCPKNAHPVVAPRAPPQVPQHVWMPKPSKGRVVAAVAGTTSSPKVLLQQDNGKLGSPSNRFAVLENFDLASDADFGFVVPIEGVGVLNISSERMIAHPSDQHFEVFLCSSGSISPHMDPVSTAVVGVSVVPPPAVPLISGESSQACESIKLASPPTECNYNSEDVISRSVQDIEVAVMQEAQFSNHVEVIPKGLDVSFEPPAAKKKPKKPNKKL
ncbi:hypothetical protein RHSIM_RhsimUnG0103400 [Rhododendron simsii]|uniref:DUF4283 domain-containing protein n=1 Tax=Rhododendron simsii TaxID=118357 RepID=A0A834G1L9_RHOSS|nr:hypothetical protein RHSIM_RhsimUnG0103400 [Rhododendron simsii]